MLPPALDGDPAARPSLREQSKLLSLNRSTLYRKPAPAPPDQNALCERINQLYSSRPYYGVRRVTAQFRGEGLTVNHKRIQRLMHQMQLYGLAPTANLSKRNLAEQISPYLLRAVTAQRVNHIWGIDITYIKLRGGRFVYLVAIIDWYSRYVVSWRLEQSLAQAFVQAAVSCALAEAKPEIMNSDQGSHFTSEQYQRLLRAAGVQISMDGKGRAIDNVLTERLWRSIKYEEVYLSEYNSPAEARLGLAEYLRFYNEERPHQALGYRTPAEVYRSEGQQQHTHKEGVAILNAASLWSTRWGTPQFSPNQRSFLRWMK